MTKNSKRDVATGGKIDKFLVTLLMVSCISLGVWATLSSLLALHFRERAKVAKINMLDARDTVKEMRKDELLKQKTSMELEMLRNEVGFLFRQLLLEKDRPETMTELLQTFQRLFNQVSNETLSRKDMIQLNDTFKKFFVQNSDDAEIVNLNVAPGVIRANESDEGTSSISSEINPVASNVKKTGEIIAPSKKMTGIRHLDQEHRFVVTFPENWVLRAEKEAGGVMASAPRDDIRDLYTAYVLIIAKQMDNAYLLDAFWEKIKTNLTEVKLVEEKQVKLSDQTAEWMCIHFVRGYTDFKAVYLLLHYKKIGYIVSFSAPRATFSEYQKVFDGIIEHFEFL